MIAATDLPGVDANLARRIIAVARFIAPCLDSLVDEPRLDAIALLVGVAAEAKARGSRLVKSQRVGPASVDYSTAGSWFSDDDKSALRALCGVSATGGHPIGAFPKPSRAYSRLWPEEMAD